MEQRINYVVILERRGQNKEKNVKIIQIGAKIIYKNFRSYQINKNIKLKDQEKMLLKWKRILYRKIVKERNKLKISFKSLLMIQREKLLALIMKKIKWLIKSLIFNKNSTVWQLNLWRFQQSQKKMKETPKLMKQLTNGSNVLRSLRITSKIYQKQLKRLMAWEINWILLDKFTKR